MTRASKLSLSLNIFITRTQKLLNCEGCSCCVFWINQTKMVNSLFPHLLLTSCLEQRTGSASSITIAIRMLHWVLSSAGIGSPVRWTLSRLITYFQWIEKQLNSYWNLHKLPKAKQENFQAALPAKRTSPSSISVVWETFWSDYLQCLTFLVHSEFCLLDVFSATFLFRFAYRGIHVIQKFSKCRAVAPFD